MVTTGTERLLHHHRSNSESTSNSWVPIVRLAHSPQISHPAIYLPLRFADERSRVLRQAVVEQEPHSRDCSTVQACTRAHSAYKTTLEATKKH
jgi:hypothetical protein